MMHTIRTAWRVLTARDRSTARWLFAAMLVSAFLECVGLGLVLPVLALLADGGTSSLDLPAWLLGAVEGIPHGRLVILCMAGLLAVYAFKAAFRWMLIVRVNGFGFRLQRELSTRLFSNFISRPWSFHLSRNSTTILHGLTHDADQLVFGVVVPSLSAASELMVIIGVTTLLLAIEPLGGAACLGLVGLSGWWFHRMTEARAAGLGAQRRELDRARFRLFRQALEGVKEIRALGREQGFTALADAASARSGALGSRVQSLRDVPRSWLEVLAVLGLTTLVTIMLLQGREASSVLGVAGLFALAVFRLVPSGTRLMTSVHAIVLGAPGVQAVVDALAEPQASGSGAVGDAAWTAIEFRGVGFGYGDDRPSVLDGLEMRIARGESVGIVGASGSGKSTVVDLALGLLQPTTGTITIGGMDLAACNRWWQSQVGYVPQSIYLLDDSITRNVAFGVLEGQIDQAAVARALRLAQLDEFVSSLPQGASTVVGERGVRLSGGQRQRIGIARALYGNPTVLILDEATSALDPETEEGLLGAIHALHGTVTMLVVAHREATVERCDRLLRLEGGRFSEVDRA